MSLRTGARIFLPPFLAYAAVRLFLFIPGSISGYDTLRPGTWRRWDSGHYLSIARNGYELFPCNSPNYPPDSWCGTAAWLPGYPRIVQAVSRLSIPRPVVAVWLSGLFTFLTLLVLWAGLMKAELERANVLALLLAAFFPGGVYYHAIFPISMIALCLALWLYFLQEDRWVRAGLAAAAGAFTYPSGLLMAPLSGGWALYRSLGDRLWTVTRRILGSAGVGATGFGFVLLLHQRTLGAWDAFFKVQEKYRHDALHNPAATFARAVRPFFEATPERTMPAFQTLVVAVLLVVVALAMWRGREGVAAFDVFVLAIVATFWALPFVIGRGGSLYRSEALLFPVVLLTRFLPWPAQAAILGLFVALELHLAILFFQSAII